MALLKNFQERPKKEGVIDSRNILNDLTGKEWVRRSKSVWTSSRCAADKAAFAHPAPFLIKDAEKLITTFTKRGMVVLDPFVGSGTTLIACARSGRTGVGIELNPTFFELSQSRLSSFYSLPFKYVDHNQLEISHIQDWGVSHPQIVSKLIEIDKSVQLLINADALEVLDSIPEIDYCLTSPPYHNILHNKGDGVRHDGSQTRQGVKYYSEDPNDLGNQEHYSEYLGLLERAFLKISQRLKEKRYCTIIISDFTIDKKETNVHGDIITLMEKSGFRFEGAFILVQDSKPLFPFGYPNSKSYRNFKKVTAKLTACVISSRRMHS